MVYHGEEYVAQVTMMTHVHHRLQHWLVWWVSCMAIHSCSWTRLCILGKRLTAAITSELLVGEPFSPHQQIYSSLFSLYIMVLFVADDFEPAWGWRKHFCLKVWIRQSTPLTT